MKHFAVVGNPIAHSLSPVIHSWFAREVGIELEYVRVQAPLDAFAQTIQQLRSEGIDGVNVTVPFKLEALALADQHSAAAELAGAANTLSFKSGAVHAFNTDGLGLVGDISQNLGLVLRGRRVLMIGAGGAASGALGELIASGLSSLEIANRTPQKAEALVARHASACRQHGVDMRVRSFSDPPPTQPYDVVINATSAGLQDERLSLPDGLVNSDSLAYDMVYGKDTPFLQWAASCNARTSDGLGMLVEQAAEAFAIWHGMRPKTAVLLTHLRNRHTK